MPGPAGHAVRLRGNSRGRRGKRRVAATLLEELDRAGSPPRSYLILELSADLRERSRDTLAVRVPHLLERVAWLNRLPPAFSGVVLGNEVLDAMPVDVVRVNGGRIEEGGVGVRGDRLDWSWRAASGNRSKRRARSPPRAFAPRSSLAARGFMRSLGGVLERGVALFVDYGFSAEGVLPPAAQGGHAHVPLPPARARRSFFLPGLQ